VVACRHGLDADSRRIYIDLRVNADHGSNEIGSIFTRTCIWSHIRDERVMLITRSTIFPSDGGKNEGIRSTKSNAN
jgi:hypothetical protein